MISYEMVDASVTIRNGHDFFSPHKAVRDSAVVTPLRKDITVQSMRYYQYRRSTGSWPNENL